MLFGLVQIGCNKGNNGDENLTATSLEDSQNNTSLARNSSTGQSSDLPAIGFLDSITASRSADGSTVYHLQGWATSKLTAKPVEVLVTYYSAEGSRLSHSDYDGGTLKRASANGYRQDVKTYLTNTFRIDRPRTQFKMDLIGSEIFGVKACFEIYTDNPYSRIPLDTHLVKGDSQGCITYKSMASDLRINRIISNRYPELVVSWSKAMQKHVTLEASICVSDWSESNISATIELVKRDGSNLVQEQNSAPSEYKVTVCDSDSSKMKVTFNYEAYVFLGTLDINTKKYDYSNNQIQLVLRYLGIPSSNPFSINL